MTTWININYVDTAAVSYAIQIKVKPRYKSVSYHQPTKPFYLYCIAANRFVITTNGRQPTALKHCTKWR
jgi:hypothetical protein